MRVSVDAKAFTSLLKGMKPHSAKRAALRDPVVQISAGGSSLVLVGEFDNSASMPAQVLTAGSGEIPLNPALRVLSTYPAKAKVELRAEPGAFWLDKMRLVVSTS